MAKFKLKMKLTGFELELEGERSEVPLMAANLGQQFAQLLEPAANIAEGETPRKSVPNSSLPAAQIEDKPARGRVRRAGNGAARSSAAALTFVHDSATWGNPRQDWNPTKKVTWLLHVIEAITGTKELSIPVIAATFNSQFKQYGKVQPSNVSRDLNKLKSGTNALFVEDVADGTVSKWCLSAKGKVEAEKLVAQAKLPAVAETV